MKSKHKNRRVTRSVEEHKTTTKEIRRAKKLLQARMLDEDNEPDLNLFGYRQVPMRVWRWKQKWLKKSEYNVLVAEVKRDPDNYPGFVVRRSALIKNKALYRKIALSLLRHSNQINYIEYSRDNRKAEYKARQAKYQEAFDSCVKVTSDTEFCAKIEDIWYQFSVKPLNHVHCDWYRLTLLPYFSCIGHYLHPSRDSLRQPDYDLYPVGAFYYSSDLRSMFTKVHQDASLTLSCKQMSSKEIRKLG